MAHEQAQQLVVLQGTRSENGQTCITPTAEHDMTASSVGSESKRTRACVLLGSALLQLPIWGFAMTYGVFQEYFTTTWPLKGSPGGTGVIGTTQNGVLYLSMPILFSLFTKRYAHKRQTAAICGALLAGISFLLSSFSTKVWHLIITQGGLAALGCALIYSPTTLSLGEWFNNSNRALAYGIILSTKNIVGSACPFLLRYLLDRYGFRWTMRIWAILAAVISIAAIFLIPVHPSSLMSADEAQRRRKISWSFLKHRTIHIYSVAIIMQSSGYGIAQTYLNTSAHEVILLSQASATLMLTLFNLPGIASSSFFGYLSDNKRFPLSASTVTAMSAICSALSAFFLWGLSNRGSIALLYLFSITFGFFAGGYSATWGGVINELEREAARNNEAVDPGMLYGLLNGARGIGYVVGGLAGLPLLKAGSIGDSLGYGTGYGKLILFTGLSTICGGWQLLWRIF